jgi:outer membrane immunogenic protein
MNKIILGTAMLVGLAIGTPAIAADMPLKAPPPPVVVSDWGGFYFGAQFGEKWKKDDWTTNCINAGGPPLGTCGSALSTSIFPGAPDGTASQSFTNSGFRWGLYAGYNFQVNQYWLVGVEADWGHYDQSSTVGFIPGCAGAACTGGAFGPGPFAGDSTTVRNTWDASLRGRLGFIATPDVLIYGTGGLALQRIEENVTCTSQTFGAASPAGGAACLGPSKSETQQKTLVGYTVGGGLEWKAWQHVVLRGEYRYSEFQQFSPTFFGGQGDIVLQPTIKVRSQIATFGIAYLFGGSEAPVAAKY